ncbi:hypothetical protein GGI21_002634 [Coemansia aciculifera]|uniref:Uncharacterized protein n=1 Tax=Coemansia aciculifera TaxID=417176 RepID=A0ACC1M0D7_9FUNG|nr:hypothetical protein IWW38_004137 [Coemansia aciculifera]KAJ2908691.1 hypothetical protein GGI21_002634 [Coemansia aciculifera]
MDRQHDTLKELSDIFEPDLYNGRFNHMPSINVLLSSHLTAATVRPDNSSEITAHSLSSRRNSASSSCSDADTSNADFEDFELVDYEIPHSQSQEYLIFKSEHSNGHSHSSALSAALASAKSHRRRRASFSKFRDVVGELLSSRTKN